MIAFASSVYDPTAHAKISHPSVQSGLKYQRRVSQTATLDGNSSISDLGFTFADNRVNLSMPNISQDVINRLSRLVQLYPEVIYFSDKGVFRGGFESLDVESYPVKAVFLVGEQLA